MSWLLCLLFFLFCALRLWFSCNMFKSTVLMISTVVQKSSPSRSISRFCTNDIWINRMPIMFHSLFCSQKFCLSRQRPGRYRDGNIFFFPQKKIGFFWSSHEAGNKKKIYQNCPFPPKTIITIFQMSLTLCDLDDQLWVTKTKWWIAGMISLQTNHQLSITCPNYSPNIYKVRSSIASWTIWLGMTLAMSQGAVI